MTLLSHADYERIAANLSYPTEAFIGGTFAPALSGETMPTVNPATGKEIARVASCGREDVDKAVAAARKARFTESRATLQGGTITYVFRME